MSNIITRILQGRVKNRFDTAENWATINPILLGGEFGVESDTGLFKVGTGKNRWNTLAYQNPISSSDLEGLETDSKDIIGAINELKHMIESINNNS